MPCVGYSMGAFFEKETVLSKEIKENLNCKNLERRESNWLSQMSYQELSPGLNLFQREESFCPEDQLPGPQLTPPLKFWCFQFQRCFMACPYVPVAPASYQNKEPHQDTAQPRHAQTLTPLAMWLPYALRLFLGPQRPLTPRLRSLKSLF